MAVFTPTCHGRPKLLHNEYYYTKSSRTEKRNGEMIWRCAIDHSYPYVKCKVRGVTRVFGKQEMVKIIGKHTHAAYFRGDGTSKKRKPKEISL